MNRAQEKDFAKQVAGKVAQLGYRVTVEPTQVPNRKMWQYDPSSVFRGPRYRADMLVEDGQDYLVLEAKTRPFLMGVVAQAHDLSGYFGAPVMICIPDGVEQEIPNSVFRFADETSVKVAPLSSLESELRNAFADIKC